MSLLRAADKRELPLVVALFAVLLAEAHWSDSAHGVSPQGVLAAVAITAPLLWRSRAPHPVLVLVVLGVVACLATLKPGWSVVLPPAVAVYTVALHGDRLRSLVLAVCVTAIAGALMALYSPDGVFSPMAAAKLGILLIALVAGDAVRSRRTVRHTTIERRIADERLRIAQEVHDVVAHAMVAINVQAGVAAHVLHKRPDHAEQALTEIKRVSGTALDDLRATLGLLREDGASAPVHPTRVLHEVPDLAAPLRAAGVRVEVEMEGPEERVPAPVGAAAYRIVQEALTNVLRHADASSAAVRVAVESQSLDIDVRNDGGRANGDGARGSGLRGMTERAEALGGRIEVGGLPEGGWRVHAVLPLV